MLVAVDLFAGGRRRRRSARRGCWAWGQAQRAEGDIGGDALDPVLIRRLAGVAAFLAEGLGLIARVFDGNDEIVLVAPRLGGDQTG